MAMERERWKMGAKTRCSRARARARTSEEKEKEERREKKVKVSKNVNKQHKRLTKLELVESMVVVMVMKRCSRGDAKRLRVKEMRVSE